MIQKEFIQIYSMKLAGILMIYGHQLKRMEHNPQKFGYKTYIFKNTPALIQTIADYKKKLIDYKTELNQVYK